MQHAVQKFIRSEDGAVTVDWVVLTAAIVGLGVLVATTVGSGTMDYATDVGTYLASKTVTTTY